MLTYQAKFPVNFLTDEEDPAEPFSYSVRRFSWPDEPEQYYYRAMCHDIPCDVCEFLPTCKRSKHRDGMFEQLFKEHFPEHII